MFFIDTTNSQILCLINVKISSLVIFITEYKIVKKYTNLTASKASPIASSDQGVGFDRESSIPSLLHLPYNVPVGMPNSVEAFCTEV